MTPPEFQAWQRKVDRRSLLARRRAAGPVDPGRHVGLARPFGADRAGRVHRRAAWVADAQGPVNLAGCDVECDWVFEKSVAGGAKNIDAMREFLAKRVSLGWTDLDKAFASAFAKAGPKTRIIYVGDGIVTTGDADPVAFGKRLRRMYRDCPARRAIAHLLRGERRQQFRGGRAEGHRLAAAAGRSARSAASTAPRRSPANCWAKSPGPRSRT